MWIKSGMMVLAMSAFVWAEAPTVTEEAPVQEAPVEVPVEAPVEAPVEQPAAEVAAEKKSFPTPAELLAQLKAKQEATKAKAQIAMIDLSGAYTEAPAGFSLFGGDPNTFQSLIDRLEAARNDSELRGVLFTLGTGTSFNLSQIHELRREFDAIRNAGKRIFVYADTYGMTDYVLASAATDICVLEGGELFMPGIGIETMFYRGTMDMLGVKPDYVQIGEFKGAEEPYTRTEPSEELKGELQALTKNLYDEVVRAISISRNMPAREVERAIDETIVSGAQMVERGFADHAVDLDGLRDLMEAELGNKVNIQSGYGVEEGPKMDFSNPFALLASLTKREPEAEGPKIAVVYAQGVITDGSGDGGLFGGSGVGSDPIRRAMRMAARDEDVKAIVLRIDSPGGSALASEAMWQSIRRVADDKPVIVSIGSMAASGGYYMAVAGDYIYAEPTSIVGSIGVVGGKIVLGGLYDKVGLTTASFTQGANANLFSGTEPWTDQQRRMVRTWMKNTYDQFTDRVMETREGKIKDVDKVARGRIFLARQAIELGMVDELGGLTDAIDHAAEEAGLADGEFELMTLPPPQTFADLIAGGSGMEAVAPIKSELQVNPVHALLQLLPPNLRHVAVRELQTAELMTKRPVVLMSPYVITVK